MISKPQQETIRVSCAALCRIEIDGKFLLEINKNRGDVLTPIGGALEFDEEARPFLETLGAEFEKGNDLRLTLLSRSLADFEAWFAERKQREVDPLRELREELLSEHGLDPTIDIDKWNWQLLWTSKDETKTTRKGAEGALSRYCFEVYDIQIPPRLRARFADSVEKTGVRLFWVSEADIRKGQAPGGFEIGTNANAILSGELDRKPSESD